VQDGRFAPSSPHLAPAPPRRRRAKAFAPAFKAAPAAVAGEKDCASESAAAIDARLSWRRALVANASPIADGPAFPGTTLRDAIHYMTRR
jgi:hypothetical protein